MPKFVFALICLTMVSAGPVWAQQSLSKRAPTTTTVLQPPQVTAPSTLRTSEVTTTVEEKKTQPTTPSYLAGELKPTPEMWFYTQAMKEYKDPKAAVRAKAEFAAQQRERRLATMRWFGYSNSRPRLAADPFTNYPPSWSSNTPLQPNRWQGTGGQPYYIARPEQIETKNY